MKNDRLDIIAIKTESEEYYLSERKVMKGSYNHSCLKHLLIDGENPSPTFENEWVSVDSEPKRITKMVKQNNINHRYELQDKTLISDKLPEFIDREVVATKIDYDWVWNEDMAQYRSLYKEVSDEQPDKEEEYGFDCDVILEITEMVSPVKMAYKISRTHWDRDGDRTITGKDVHYQLVDQIILPNILLPQRPCSLTSQETYEIVRRHIKDNINPVLAEITSDYDFCFTVKRRIRLAEVVNYTIDVNNNIFQKRKRKPKYVKRQQSEIKKECFEMTWAPRGHDNYTPIKGFQANTQKELKEKIDDYCKELISFINVELIECPHCNGNGVVDIPIKNSQT